MDDFNEWISYAKKDLEAAKFLTNMHPQPLEIICYHCQQSAEKSIKALIIKSGIQIKKTHDLLLLLQDLKNKIDINPIKIDCAELTNYSVITRYPYNFGDSIDETRMKRAICSAEKILNFVLDNAL